VLEDVETVAHEPATVACCDASCCA
jgi:hypothetical protein